MRRRTMFALLVAVVSVPSSCIAIGWLRVALDDELPSRSVGLLSHGHLEHGHAIPPWGRGYRTCSILDSALGRQYLHGDVRRTLLEAFAERAARDPGRIHILGETAIRQGGPFHGHRTHQTGLSVDLFMPVRDDNGERATLPTWPWQGMGYWWEFDAEGRADHYRIDFEELAQTLISVEAHARVNHLEVVRVIIAPEFVPRLLATPAGRTLGVLGEKLTRRPVWVRHDEHVHIDFETRGR